MRRLAITLFILLSAFVVSAQSLLDTFEQSLAKLGAYKVCFTVNLDDSYTLTGEYVVEGTNFYVRINGSELYVADGVKYEVSVEKREVVIDSAESLGSDVLSNPAKAFARLKEQYNVEQTEVGGCAAVNLTAKSGEHSATVVADSSGVLPESIVYTEEGSSVKITFTSITGHKDSLPRFDRAKYAGYEVIDMR